MTSDYRLKIPEQNLDKLSVCEASVPVFQKWVESLPKANIGETSRQVYTTVEELGHLVVDSATRLQLLELIRDPVHYVCEALGKHFLNQPALLKEKQLKVANLAQALQADLALGYKAAVLQQVGIARPGDKLLAKAIHRAITELSRTLLRSCQLYAAAPDNVWLDLHQLYKIAEEKDLLDVFVNEDTNRWQTQTNVGGAYKRALMLGCCRPNQLRQRDLQNTYNAIELWTDRVEIHDHGKADDLFSFDIEQDLPPAYRGLAAEIHSEHSWRGMDTSKLVKALDIYSHTVASGASAQNNPDAANVPEDITPQVLDHLASAWGVMSERAFSRREAGAAVTLCVGLTAVQYFVAGMIDFDIQMAGGVTLSLENSKSNPFLNEDSTPRGRTMAHGQASGPDDPWGGAFDAGGGGFKDINVDMLERILGGSAGGGSEAAPGKGPKVSRREQLEAMADEEATHPLYEVKVVNTSPGGYCVDWEDQASERIQDGQIVGLREEGEASWGIGVIRWIQRRDVKHLRTGIELISANAFGCGAAVLHKDRPKLEFMRALEIPEMDAVNLPATLIVPNVPFRPGNKVYINRMGTITKAVLNETVKSTGSFNQFQFTVLAVGGQDTETQVDQEEGGEEKAPKSDAPDDFDSLWSDL